MRTYTNDLGKGSHSEGPGKEETSMFADKLSFFFTLWLAPFFPVQGSFQGYLELAPSLLIAVAKMLE